MKECLWYNGEIGCYELLDFNPNELTEEQIKEKAEELLREKYSFTEQEMEKVRETIYLIDINNLEKI